RPGTRAPRDDGPRRGPRRGRLGPRLRGVAAPPLPGAARDQPVAVPGRVRRRPGGPTGRPRPGAPARRAAAVRESSTVSDTQRTPPTGAPAGAPAGPAYPACAVVDLAAVRDNVRALAGHAPSAQVMAVVKADAYGHGLVA